MKRLFFKKQSPEQTPQKPLPSLALCLVMDFLGYASYGIPFFGEFLDILWAPLSALVFMRMFGGTRGILGGAFNFLEELMPGLDFIPTFTIAWLMQYFKRSRPSSFTLKPIAAGSKRL